MPKIACPSMLMLLSQRAKDGADIAAATYDGRAFEAATRHGATMALARQLVAAGVPDVPYEAQDPAGRLRFSGPSSPGLARLTVSEPDESGHATIRAWTPAPIGRFKQAGVMLSGTEALAGAWVPGDGAPLPGDPVPA